MEWEPRFISLTWIGSSTLLPVLNPHSGYIWMWVNLVVKCPCVFFNPLAMFVNAMYTGYGGVNYDITCVKTGF